MYHFTAQTIINESESKVNIRKVSILFKPIPLIHLIYHIISLKTDD